MTIYCIYVGSTCLGKRKIDQFGAGIIEIIQYYCTENNIEKGKIPLQEVSTKEKKPKVDTKKVSFDLFQSGKTIAEIALRSREQI